MKRPLSAVSGRLREACAKDGDLFTAVCAVDGRAAGVDKGSLVSWRMLRCARLADLPEVPAVADSFPGFEAVTCGVICVNAGTSQANTARLADAINRVTAPPAVRERLLAAGTQPVGDSTPASSRAYWLAEYAKWRDVIRTVGIKLE